MTAQPPGGFVFYSGYCTMSCPCGFVVSTPGLETMDRTDVAIGVLTVSGVTGSRLREYYDDHRRIAHGGMS